MEVMEWRVWMDSRAGGRGRVVPPHRGARDVRPTCTACRLGRAAQGYFT